MALEIIENKIVGTIEDLEAKLNGELPINRLELLYLVNSWGRTDFFYTEYLEENLRIEECKAKKCYNLSRLDTSKITNMDNLFKYSLFTDIHSTNGIGLHDGDISNWDVSNVTSMYGMFFYAENFNQALNNWDVSNVENMNYMFCGAKMFNQNISKWNFDNIMNCNFMFNKTESFLDKYNSGEPLPSYTDKVKEWFNLNSDKIKEIDIKEKHGEEIDGFFSNFSNNHKNKEINNNIY